MQLNDLALSHVELQAGATKQEPSNDGLRTWFQERRIQKVSLSGCPEVSSAGTRSVEAFQSVEACGGGEAHIVCNRQCDRQGMNFLSGPGWTFPFQGLCKVRLC